MVATQLRAQGRKLRYGSLMALLTGTAAFTLGSMNKRCCQEPFPPHLVFLSSYLSCYHDMTSMKL